MTAVLIRELQVTDEKPFLEMTNQSQMLHHPWVNPPQTTDEFNDFFQRSQQPNQKSYIVYLQNNDIVGVINVSEIVRGFFQSAYLGFYAGSAYKGKGLMSQGLKLLLNKAFTELNLHRIEANIQPGNLTSIQLVSKNGFKREGFSPRYLKINDKWCDHERWALTLEDYLSGPPSTLPNLS